MQGNALNSRDLGGPVFTASPGLPPPRCRRIGVTTWSGCCGTLPAGPRAWGDNAFCSSYTPPGSAPNPRLPRSTAPNCPKTVRFPASVVSLTEQSGRIVYSVDQRVAGHDEVPLGESRGLMAFRRI